MATPSNSERRAEALAVAEEAREASRTLPSFAAEVFLGHLRPELFHPFPRQSDEDRAIGDKVLAQIETVLREEIDPDEVDRTGEIPARALERLREADAFRLKLPTKYGGLGLSQTGTQKAIAALPSTVTLAFAPQGNSIDRWMQTARREGHEIMMQVPLEPFGYPQVDPGRNTLIAEDAPGDNLDRLHWALGRTTNYTGIVNYMGGRFLSDPAAMDPIMQDLANRGLLFLDDGSAARSVAADLALRKGVPFTSADFAIDTEQNRGAILKKLDELERTARARGFALGTGSAFNATVSAVSSWIREASKRGIEIVPVSALARDPERK